MPNSTKKTPKPRGADPSKTRAKILKAARKLFIAGGLNGTSMRAIAQKAQVTQSLLHHHFGSKAALWQKVKETLLNEYFSEIEQQVEAEEQSTKKRSLADTIEFRFRFIQHNPDIVRIGLWQQLDNYKQPSSAKGQKLLTHLMEWLHASQQRNEIRQDIPPGLITAIIFILTSGWFNQDSQWILNLDPKSNFPNQDEQDEAYLEAIKKIFLNGILAPEQKPED
jgi:TetR/AcrR family transcriptional regulator